MSDVALVGEVAAPVDGFALAWQQHHAALLRFARLLVGDHAAAEDLVNEAFARTWRRWRSGAVDNLEPYLKRAVVNGCRDRARRRIVERRKAHLEHRPEGVTDPDGGDACAVRAALDELRPHQRAVVVLRYYEDRSEADIARLLGIRPGTVKSQLSRGLARLREALQDKEEDRDG